jgi:hypothetical protein
MGKYNCNKDVFSNIETEREAYWLGFILADGHNHQNKILRVDIKDERHLDDLSNLIYPEGNKPIKIRDLGFGPVYYFHCGVGDVVRNLSNNGVIPNKSKKASLPIIPDDMYRHFIRGLFDGDGSLSFNYDGNYRRYMFSIVGNDDLMVGVKNVVKSQIGVDLGFGKMKMIHRVYKKGNQQIITILRWLYDDSIVSLERKNKRFQEMLDYYKNKQKK